MTREKLELLERIVFRYGQHFRKDDDYYKAREVIANLKVRELYEHAK